MLCTDSQWPTEWSKWEADTRAIYSYAPLEAWGNTWFNAPCIDWPEPAQQPVAVNGDHVKSTLLIDETLDAATPFEGSLVVRQLLPHSVLVAESGGTSHANSLPGNLCVDGTIAEYLETGTLPARSPSAPWVKTCAQAPPQVSAATSAAEHADAVSAVSVLGRLGTPAARIHLPAAAGS